MDQANPPEFGRNSQIEALTDFLEQRLDSLVDQSIEIAKSNGYAPFTTTIRAAWVEAILSVTESLRKYLAAETVVAKGPLATLDYAADPRFARMRLIARQHRSLGITMQMYIGLFKHFRNLYLNELEDAPTGLRREEAARVRDFFDETELSISADWTSSNDNHRLRELQERARAITLDKDRYFAVFESLQNPAFLLDREGNLVNANQASAELFLGQDAQAGDIIYLRSMRLRKKSLKDVVNQIMDVAQKSEDPVWLDTLDGRHCFDIRKRVLHDAVENMALGHVVLLNDVTAHQQKADQARESEQGMSRFLATMSHEIKTPLHSVLGAAELLRTAKEANADTYLDVIEGAGKALLLTLNNVLDYSKFENEPPVARPTDTDLFEEIRAFARFVAIRRGPTQTPLGFDIDPGVPKSAHVDWGMTQQVLSNLVSNALKADNGKGVLVSVRREEETDTCKTLRFEVRDHGPGIPGEAAAALFRPFEHTMARDTGDGGSGLGLAISHYLVEAMQGRIGYENRSQGAIVWFEIPYRKVQGADDDDRQIPDPTIRSPVTAQLCLLVDDDPIGAIVTTHQLEHLGLVVTHAASVAEATDFAAQADFDVFVVDYLLPDGDGPSLVRDLKTRLRNRPRILALTANAEALADQTGEFDAVLTKPVGQIRLASAIFGSGTRVFPVHREPRGKFEGLQGLAPETIAAMIVAFSAAWADFRMQLRSGNTASSIQDLAMTAHRLAGSCAVMGLAELEPVLRRLEANCQSEDTLVNTTAQVAALDRDLTEVASWRRLTEIWAAE